MKNKFILILSLSFILSACTENKTPQVIDKNGMTVTLPGFVKVDELAEDAFIEYANRYRNFYIAGFELNSKQPFDSVMLQSIDRITKNLSKFKIDTIRSSSNELVTKIKGNFKDEKEAIYYSLKLVPNAGKYYLISVWTRGESRNKHHAEAIDGIISSFKPKVN